MSQKSVVHTNNNGVLAGERTSKDSNQTALCGSEGINELNTKSSAGFIATLSVVDNSRKKVNIDNIIEENVHTSVEAAENIKQMSSRFNHYLNSNCQTAKMLILLVPFINS